MVQMKRIRADKDAKNIAQATQMQDDSVGTATRVETDPTPPMSREEEERYWIRETHPLHDKYKHLSALASYPDIMLDDEYPGEYIKPDAKSTHIPYINAVRPGRLFKATPKSRAFYTPPGSYSGKNAKVDFFGHWADEVFGIVVEYLIDEVRCGIIWDVETRAHASMLAVGFYSRHPDWTQLKMWTNVARMELQDNKYGKPGTKRLLRRLSQRKRIPGRKIPCRTNL